MGHVQLERRHAVESRGLGSDQLGDGVQERCVDPSRLELRHVPSPAAARRWHDPRCEVGGRRRHRQGRSPEVSLMPITIPNDIEPLTPADATEVDQNYKTIQQHINTNLIDRSGAVAMTGQLTLVGDPIDSRHAASKGYVDSFLPIGVILPYAAPTVPAGGAWLLCDGAALPTTTWPELFAVCQYRYGGGGATFNLPNLTARIPVGLDATQTRFNTPGKTGGSWVAALQQHNHVMTHNHPSFASGV